MQTGDAAMRVAIVQQLTMVQLGSLASEGRREGSSLPSAWRTSTRPHSTWTWWSACTAFASSARGQRSIFNSHQRQPAYVRYVFYSRQYHAPSADGQLESVQQCPPPTPKIESVQCRPPPPHTPRHAPRVLEVTRRLINFTKLFWFIMRPRASSQAGTATAG